MLWLDEDGLKRLWAHIVALIDHKVEKVEGKDLSSNDYTDTEKNKLATIEVGADKTIVDEALDSESTHPVQNKVIKEALDNLSAKLGDEEVGQLIMKTMVENQADFAITDRTSPSYIKNKPSQDEALEMLAEAEVVQPMADENGALYVDNNNALYVI